MLIKGATLLQGSTMDVRVTGTVIEELAESLAPRDSEHVIDGRERTLIPGLHDHHIHFFALAAARSSLQCGPPFVQGEAALLELLNRACVGKPASIRGVGYHESVAGDLGADYLDAACGPIPTKVQHRSGRLWYLNSAAMQLLPPVETWPQGAERDSAGKPTGRFYNADDWLRQFLTASPIDIHNTSLELARYGITGFTDAGPDNDQSTLQMMRSSQKDGSLLQRVVLMGRLDLPAYRDSFLRRGPVKIYLREVDLPDFDSLCASISKAHSEQRNVAFHCVTLGELHYALESLDSAGFLQGDRIEHASVADDFSIDRIAACGATVVTQPHFIYERGDQYLQQVPVDEQPFLYRGAAFLGKGVPFAAGSDAPFGEPDPWVAIRAAKDRRTRDGVSMRDDECIAPARAFELFLGDPMSPARTRKVEQGAAADLCLLSGTPEDVVEDPSRERVEITLINGKVVWRRGR
ncbi:MAG: amidohydrolase family protein [Halieaceae bacterium]|jgi:predicted amidohydrolase YtcJ|nr:amidohydrolase family protein [Halieaceae bacterium]